MLKKRNQISNEALNWLKPCSTDIFESFQTFIEICLSHRYLKVVPDLSSLYYAKVNSENQQITTREKNRR